MFEIFLSIFRIEKMRKNKKSPRAATMISSIFIIGVVTLSASLIPVTSYYIEDGK